MVIIGMASAGYFSKAEAGLCSNSWCQEEVNACRAAQIDPTTCQFNGQPSSSGGICNDTVRC